MEFEQELDEIFAALKENPFLDSQVEVLSDDELDALPRPTYAEFIQALRRIPPNHAALGLDEQGYPVLIPFQGNDIGSTLVIGDANSQKERLLCLLLQSASQTNPYNAFQAAVLTADPATWLNLVQTRPTCQHVLEMRAGYDTLSGRMILRIAASARRRALALEHRRPLLFLVDDLKIIEGLDFDARVNFEWLLRTGNSLGIHIFCAATPETVYELGQYADLCRTWVMGSINNSIIRTQMASIAGLDPEWNIPQGMFTVCDSRSGLNFWLPEYE
ncbi:MAG TPA: hypothetical protein VIO61_02325 [Anaerolineaceae bacterium]